MNIKLIIGTSEKPCVLMIVLKTFIDSLRDKNLRIRAYFNSSTAHSILTSKNMNQRLLFMYYGFQAWILNFGVGIGLQRAWVIFLVDLDTPSSCLIIFYCNSHLRSYSFKFVYCSSSIPPVVITKWPAMALHTTQMRCRKEPLRVPIETLAKWKNSSSLVVVLLKWFAP